MRTFCLALVCVLVGCDSSEPEPGPLDGSYVQFGGRRLLDGAVFNAGIYGVYYAEALDLSGGAFSVKVFSDYQPEVGEAAGRFVTVGQGLRLDVESSTTPVYPARSAVAYDEARALDGAFRDARSWEDLGIVFEGPGLVLTEYRTDTYDYDEDGDRSEQLTVETYYTTRETAGASAVR